MLSRSKLLSVEAVGNDCMVVVVVPLSLVSAESNAGLDEVKR